MCVTTNKSQNKRKQKQLQILIFKKKKNITCILYPDISTEPTTNTMLTSTAKPITNQSDIGAPTSVNQMNEIKKDTTSTLNNSSHSKIPVLNPNARSMKCASWAGNDYPITPDMNDLTPGNTHLSDISYGYSSRVCINAYSLPILPISCKVIIERFFNVEKRR